jgi:hypothetical protein
MLRTLRRVEAGELPFDPGVAQRLMDFYSNPGPAGDSEVLLELTAHEAEALGHVTEGADGSDVGASPYQGEDSAQPGLSGSPISLRRASAGRSPPPWRPE